MPSSTLAIPALPLISTTSSDNVGAGQTGQVPDSPLFDHPMVAQHGLVRGSGSFVTAPTPSTAPPGAAAAEHSGPAIPTVCCLDIMCQRFRAAGLGPDVALFLMSFFSQDL